MNFLKTVKIKVRILAGGHPSDWFGEMDEVTAELFDTDPPVYKITEEDADDECEFKKDDMVFCLDDKERGLVAAWKA
jgi:hypothetical protein